MNISFKISIILVMLFAIIAPRCHALSDYAGQGKAPITWDELMQPRVDPSRYFATPGGGHGVHPAGGYDAPQAKAKPDKPAAPEVKPDVKPPMPHIPLVPAPKPQPEVKPEPKPEPEVKPDCKPETHKCWSFKFRPVKRDCTPKAKPDCKHESVKPDKKPSCSKGGDQKKSECSKPAGDKPSCKPSGMHGRGFGFGRQGHGVGKGAGHGHGKGCGRG